MALIGTSTRWAALLLCLLLAAQCSAKQKVRVLFLTDCTVYSDWQSIGMVYSYMYSGHYGPVTKVMCCTDEERKKYNKEMLQIVDTHIAPSMTVHPTNGDVYAAYNKPEAVIDYMAKVTPDEEYLVVLDSDMILRTIFSTDDYNVSKGWAVGARYDYMIGVNNKLAENHIPEIARRNDSFAGPVGRRSDMVGGFFFIHREDLKALSKLWLKYTEDVRFDPEAWKYTGDAYATKPGIKPWISEMYGYSYGAAKANVWHHWDEYTMLYPGYHPSGIPRVLHYGLEWEVEGYKFDKHWYTNFDVYKCAPWNLNVTQPQHGIFPHPPRPSDLKSKMFMERYRDLIALEAPATLNAGLCWWHKKRCPAHPQITAECDKAEKIFFEVKEALRIAQLVYDCVDFRTECGKWASKNECVNNQNYMEFHCKASCNKCQPKPEAAYPRILDLLSNPEAKVLVPQQVYPMPRLDDAKAPTIAADDANQKVEALRGSGQDLHEKRTPDGSAEEKPTTTTTITATTKVEHPTAETPVVATPSPVASHDDAHPRFIAHDGGASTSGSLTQEEVQKVADDLLQHKSLSDLKALMRRCFLMGSLTIDEVKACKAAAQKGDKWEKVVPPVRQSKVDEAKVKSHLETHNTITKPSDIHAAQTTTTRKSGLESALSWQTMAIWGLVLVVVLYAVPKILRARKRARSGMRAE